MQSREAAYGGELTVSIRTEPRNFGRFGPRESTTDLVNSLLHASLVRINRQSDDVEPWLAEGWSKSADGLTYTITLREGVTFSDGHPLTTDDVVFSFQAVYAAGVPEAIEVDGKRLTVTAVDPRTVTITFPSPFAPGLRILDNVVILPKHKLQPLLAAGKLTTAWLASTPPSEMAGLGPFVVSSFEAGQRLVLAKNPHYWRKSGSASLPYIDRVVFDIIPDEQTQLLRLEAGQIDMTSSQLPAEDYAPLKKDADAGRVKLYDLGPALYPDFFWINLKPGAFAGDPRAAWIQRDELRAAISLAVDRQLFADTVFLGAGVPVFGPVSPAIKKWYWEGTPKIPHDPERAKKLLASIGLVDRNGDGILRDAGGRPAKFTVVTQKGRPPFERGVAVIRDELKKIGLTVDAVPLDGNAVVDQFVSGKYEAIYINAYQSTEDPALTSDVWLSSGSSHFWNPEQKTPATAWEKAIDAQMHIVAVSSDATERKRAFDEVQQIFVEHQPAIYFVAQRQFVASSTRVGNIVPVPTRPQLLWEPDTIKVSAR